MLGHAPPTRPYPMTARIRSVHIPPSLRLLSLSVSLSYCMLALRNRFRITSGVIRRSVSVWICENCLAERNMWAESVAWRALLRKGNSEKIRRLRTNQSILRGCTSERQKWTRSNGNSTSNQSRFRFHAVLPAKPRTEREQHRASNGPACLRSRLLFALLSFSLLPLHLLHGPLALLLASRQGRSLE